jgi:hypothetical protein
MRRNLALALALGLAVVGLLGPAPAEVPTRRTKPAAVADVTPRRLLRIRAGTVLGERPPQGWSHLVLMAKPRLGAGDVQSVPQATAHYAGLVTFVVLANVRATHDARGQTQYKLDKVGIGTALEVGGRTVTATSDQTFGKDLGLIGRRVFQEQETLLENDFRQVARTRTLLIFDAKAIVLHNRHHSRLVLRHAILVSPHEGTLATFVWLLGSDGKDSYALAERTLQRLAPNLHEDRVLSVDADKFTLGIPAHDAFALVRIPQGTPVEVTPALRAVAAARHFTPELAVRLEEQLRAAASASTR